MAVDVVHSIGAGEAYSTIAAWEAAIPGDLVSLDERWVGRLKSASHVGGVTVAARTTDTNRNIVLECEPGASWRDDPDRPLRYNTSCARIETASGFVSALLVACNHTVLRGLQVKTTQPTSNPVTVSVASCLVDSCVLSGTGTSLARSTLVFSANGGLGRNCLLVQESDATARIFAGGTSDGSGNVLENCTLIGRDPDNIAIRRNFSSIVLRNCAVFGCGSLTEGTGGAIAFTTCATDLAGAPTGFVGSLVYGDQFADIDNSGQGWKLKAGGALPGAASDLSGSFATDAYGTLRDAWDIGAHELQAAGEARDGATLLSAGTALAVTGGKGCTGAAACDGSGATVSAGAKDAAGMAHCTAARGAGALGTKGISVDTAASGLGRAAAAGRKRGGGLGLLSAAGRLAARGSEAAPLPAAVRTFDGRIPRQRAFVGVLRRSIMLTGRPTRQTMLEGALP